MMMALIEAAIREAASQIKPTNPPMNFNQIEKSTRERRKNFRTRAELMQGGKVLNDPRFNANPNIHNSFNSKEKGILYNISPQTYEASRIDDQGTRAKLDETRKALMKQAGYPSL